MFWTNQRVHHYQSLTGDSAGTCIGGIAFQYLLHIAMCKPNEDPRQGFDIFDLHMDYYGAFFRGGRHGRCAG